MRKYITLLLITLTTLVFYNNADAQRISTLSKQGVDSAFKSERLETLPGMPGSYYSSGYTIRAKAIQKLIKNSQAYYQAKYPDSTFNIRCYVLNQYDWKTAGFIIPYGVPFYDNEHRCLVIAAEKNAINKLNHVPDDTAPDSIVSGYDYIAVHELGHYFFDIMAGHIPQHWMNELLADYFFVYYVKENNLLPYLDAMVNAPRPKTTYTNLTDFERLYMADGMSPANYDWYQMQFIKLALKLYPQLNQKLIDETLKNYSANGKNLAPVDFLKTLAPETMKTWLATVQ